MRIRVVMKFNYLVLFVLFDAFYLALRHFVFVILI